MLCGELDECSAPYTRNIMDELVDTNCCNKVIVDLSELEFMDSTGIGVLIGRYKKLKLRNKKIFDCIKKII
jgi:stage II sporulation protein AA (anti-sigma F factor antagonist)